ncbi:methyl-accepting chemotaxis protein [Selenomonas ruminis]|uniref:Methyl-accepting chemotaxis protein n=1 Tax=Selenomonas ruminis TaxID=2593411 RepID=A0A5D6VY69_9FIRM|nr:HAMP domain-containing methyl-accepting chemotaxis protein [Selenomonas sp. mPRGC5]TYZ20616.1 methyl-accepting chemotaxis protein [Selenomonas sp. mPRGC5]
MGFDQLKVAYKLLLIVAIAAIAMIGISVTGYRSLSNADNEMKSMYDHEMQGVQKLGTAVEFSRVMMVKTLQAVTLQDNPERLKKVVGQKKEAEENVEKSIAEYKAAVKGMPIEDTSDIDAQWANYKKIMDHTVDLANQGKHAEALTYYEKEGSPATRGLRDAFHNQQKKVNEQAEANEQASRDANSAAAMMIMVVTLVALLVQAGASLMTARNITNALDAMRAVCEKLRDGDFRGTALSLNRGDEFGHLSRVLSDMQQKLGNYMKGISNAIKDISSSSGNLKEASMQSAQAAVQSAESVGEAAHLVIEQESKIKESQDLLMKVNDSIQTMRAHANDVTTNSMTAADEAKQGNKALETSVREIRDVEATVSSTAEMVSRLGNRSEEIGAIVDTISEIASQTNLLALNAAIEAARAGEQGRGFSVVAEEVRKLAEQSEEAAQKIAELINAMQQDTSEAVDSMKQGCDAVVSGAKSVEELQAVFNRIHDLVQDGAEKTKEMDEAIRLVNEDAQNIANSVSEISSKGQVVSEHMESVSAATEEQSASSEEIASASDSLSHMAAEQEQALRQFKF